VLRRGGCRQSWPLLWGFPRPIQPGTNWRRGGRDGFAQGKGEKWEAASGERTPLEWEDLKSESKPKSEVIASRGEELNKGKNEKKSEI